jgi:hypothetical protein
MALDRQTSLAKFGSSYAWIQEIDPVTGATTGTTMKMPIIKESTFGYTPGSEEKLVDESGDSWTVSSASGEVSFKGTMFRTSTLALLDFFVTDRSKQYRIIKLDNDKKVLGKIGVYVYPNVKLAGNFELKNNGAEVAFEFSCAKAIAAGTVTIDATNCPGNPVAAADLPTSVAIAIGDLYGFAEKP